MIVAFLVYFVSGVGGSFLIMLIILFLVVGITKITETTIAITITAMMAAIGGSAFAVC